MRVVILCAGEATRWGGHLGVAKHLVPVNGEPILHRTVRLLRELQPGVEVYIAARPEDLAAYAVPGAVTFEADLDCCRFDADKFLSSREYWARECDTVLLYGDCFFSEDALRVILGTSVDDWSLFARFSGSELTGSQWPEIFAFRIARGFQGAFEQAGEQLIALYRSRQLRRIGGWEFYAQLTGRDVSCPAVFAGNAVVINDWTEDFDTPAEFDSWCQRLVMGGAFHVL